MNSLMRETLIDIDQGCIRCGLCVRVQSECGQSNPSSFGDLAFEVLASLESGVFSDSLVDFARSCLTCGRCTTSCPVDIRSPEAVMTFRAAIVEANPQVAADYRRYRCDLDDSMFNRMRSVTAAVYDEALDRKLAVQVPAASGPSKASHRPAVPQAPTRPQVPAMPRKPSTAVAYTQTSDTSTAQTLFFPGCTLANNFPGLTHAAYEKLKSLGKADCITKFCCGRPLSLMGLSQNRESYDQDFADCLKAAGVKKLITACPNCFYALRKTFNRIGIDSEIELSFIAGEFLDAKMRFNPSKRHPYQKISIHDSCPDRYAGIIAKQLRELFSEVEVVELEHSRSNSVCCGAGGFASVFKPDLGQKAFSAGVSDFYAARSRCLVTTCANCASTFKSSGALKSCHYLELLLDIDMDMPLYNKAIDHLWNPSNPLNLERFEKDEPFFVKGT